MTAKKNFFTAGMEVECIINGKIHNFPQGGYHNGIPLEGTTFWNVETDSTISPDGSEKFSTGRNDEETERTRRELRPLEIISNKARNKKEWDFMLDEFKAKFSKNGKYELNQVIHFPTSTGNHIHFSIRGFRFTSKFPYSSYAKLREYFLDKMNKSKIESKNLIISNYFRSSYAKKISRKQLFGRDRYEEFNLASEYSGRGLEWRSPCLHHLQTWKEFDEMMNILWDSLKYLYKLTLKYDFKSYSIIPKMKSLDKTEIDYEEKIPRSEYFESIIKLKEKEEYKQSNKYLGTSTKIEVMSE